MIRKVIQIDEEMCNGCGACASACHEGAIGMVNGKAKLLREDYCDGLGDCLPACPMSAISFIERDTDDCDNAALNSGKAVKSIAPPPCGCPGTQPRSISHDCENSAAVAPDAVSRLSQWPVQIKLVPTRAHYFDGARLLIAADCTAYAYAAFHEKLIKGHVTIIGCPKLDSLDYSGKLTDIISNNNIKSVTVVRMEVPCCGGLETAARAALQNSGKFIPWQVVTISTDGHILD